MIFLFEDPLRAVLGRYLSGVYLGSGDPTTAPNFDRDAFVDDLKRARRRNTMRFYLILVLMAAVFAAVIGFAFANPNGVKPQWLLGGTGLYSSGLGALLLQVGRSWWRTDTILTFARYCGPDTLELTLRTLLSSEASGGTALRYLSRNRPQAAPAQHRRSTG